MTDYAGANALGRALSGMGQPNQDAYYEGAKRAVSLEDAIANAKLARQKAQTMADMPAAIRNFLRDTPEAGELAAAVIPGGAGADFNATMSGLGRHANNQRASQNYELAQTEGVDPNALNLLLAATTGKPLTAGNLDVVNRSTAMTDAEVAQAEQRRAAAGASSANAGADNARAGLYGAQTVEVAPNAVASRDANVALAERRRRVDDDDEDGDLTAAVTAQPEAQPPPAALKAIMALKPGQVATFPNGQTWKLVNGKPKRIK